MITVVGWLGTRVESLDPERRGILEDARVIYAREELVSPLRALNPRARLERFARPFARSVAAMRAETEPIVVVASGDPGFFGLTRTLARELPDAELRILPGPSSVQALAARLARPWDDLACASMLGQRASVGTAQLRAGVAQGRAVALLLPSGFRCRAILEALEPVDGLHFVLGARLWTPDEAVQQLTEEELGTLEVAAESVLLVEPSPRPARPSPFREGWACTDGGNFTRLEVRMVAIARLDPPRLPFGAQVVEVGAGSGLVGLTLAWIRPDLELTALEPRAQRAEMAKENARRLGLPTTVRTLTIAETTGRFDAAVVGGGGIEALAATLARVPPSAPVVAMFADGHRAHHAAELLGNLELVSVSHAVPFGPRANAQASMRLDPAHPVWVAWR